MNYIEEIKSHLKNNLSDNRYNHCLRVADEARKLAIHYKIDEESTYIAGLLHDIAKEYDKDKRKEIVDKYNLDNNLLYDNNNRIAHAQIGAIVAKELYQVNDDIYNAIKYHTIGNIKMNTLAKIIYIADKIEPGKTFVGIDKQRELAYKDLDLALIECINNSKIKLNNEDKDLNIETKKLLEYLLEK